MADSRKAPPLPKTPRHTRHVLFSDLPPKQNQHHNHPLPDEKNCRPFCLSLCAWACLSLCAVVLLVLLVGILFASFLHATLPEIAIAGLELRLPNSTKVADSIELFIEFSNQNEKFAVSFGQLAVETSSQRVDLGRTRIGAFSQGPRNTTELRVSTAVEKRGEDAEELVSDLNNSEAVLDVTLRGKVGFHIGGIDMDGVPVLVSCNPQKSEVDQGKKSRCSVRICPF